jgi:hypothetical protein
VLHAMSIQFGRCMAYTSARPPVRRRGGAAHGLIWIKAIELRSGLSGAAHPRVAACLT